MHSLSALAIKNYAKYFLIGQHCDILHQLAPCMYHKRKRRKEVFFKKKNLRSGQEIGYEESTFGLHAPKINMQNQ